MNLHRKTIYGSEVLAASQDRFQLPARLLLPDLLADIGAF